MKTKANKIQPAVRLTVAGVLLAVSAQTSAAIITLDASDVIAAGATQSGDLNGKTIFWTPATCLSCDVGFQSVYTVNPNINLGADGISLVTGDIASLIYKANVDETSPVDESEELPDSYLTVFSNTSTDPQEATISWLPAEPSATGAHWLEVKDGNADPSTYLFDISAWNGTDTLQLINFWPGQGAISHVAIWGDAQDVPEPRTLALICVGLLGFGLRHLKRAGIAQDGGRKRPLAGT